MDAARAAAAVDGLRPTHKPLGKRSAFCHSSLENEAFPTAPTSPYYWINIRVQAERREERSHHSRPIYGVFSCPSTAPWAVVNLLGLSVPAESTEAHWRAHQIAGQPLEARSIFMFEGDRVID